MTLQYARNLNKIAQRRDAARAMLAALYEIARASGAEDEDGSGLLKAWRQVNDAIIRAEAAGIKAEGRP